MGVARCVRTCAYEWDWLGVCTHVLLNGLGLGVCTHVLMNGLGLGVCTHVQVCVHLFPFVHMRVSMYAPMHAYVGVCVLQFSPFVCVSVPT